MIIYALKDILKASFGGEWGNDCISGDGVAVLRTTNFTNTGDISYSCVIKRNINDRKIQKKKLLFGDIILEKSGGTKNTPVGRVVYFNGANKVYLCNNFTQVLRPNSQMVDAKYLFYCLYAKYQFRVTEGLYNKTTGIQNLQMDRYFNLPIPVVEREQQLIICKQLDVLRTTIEKKKQILRKFDDLVKSQFIEMFGSVEDNKNGFKVIKIKDACNLINGRAFKPEEWTPSGLRIVRIQNLNNENASFNYFDGEVKTQHLIENGELLFSWSGTPGTSFGAFFWTREKAALNQHIFKVKIKCDFTPSFLEKALNGRLKYIISRAHGGVGLQHITKKELDEIELLLPPIDLQNQFAAFVEQTDKSKVLVENAEKLMQIFKNSIKL